MLHPDPVSPITRSAPPAWWLRALSHLPWSVLYGLTATAAVIAHRVLRHRRRIVRSNIAGSFPEIARSERRAIERAYYRGSGEVFAELIKLATLQPQELCRRVSVRNLELAERWLRAGRSVLIACAHQCNPEWLLLALSLKLGHPFTLAYKPSRGAREERWLCAVRARFGGELVPVKELLMHALRRRAPQAVAMAADEEPQSAEHKWWTLFLNRPTAFYMGPEKIAQRAKFAMLFAGMRRTARGHYEIELTPISDGSQSVAPGILTERYARRVEAQVKAAPSDWSWAQRRWRLRRPLYARATGSIDPGI